jgi:glutathione synthase/RimK-type ligase-like ATP-grasp enzyme
MMHVIIRTGGGRKYARRIGQELKRINPRNEWIMPSVSYFPESFRRRPRLNPRNTLIHSRAAYPDGPNWMRNLVAKELEGFKVINNTNVLRLTSNKYKCAIKMYEAGLPHPKTWTCTHSEAQIATVARSLENENITKIIIKPYTSMSQGEHVQVRTIEHIHICTCSACGHTHRIEGFNNPGDPVEHLREAVVEMPTSNAVIQEYVPYTAIYRVVVIGGRALPISWRDVPTANRWRVSVCLNRSMEFVPHSDRELLRLAERTQRVIGGEVNFIDVFETREGYVLSEINTACNLLIHEEKARQAESTHWNIARYIARYLDEQARRL